MAPLQSEQDHGIINRALSYWSAHAATAVSLKPTALMGGFVLKSWGQLDGLVGDGGDQDARVWEIFAMLIPMGVFQDSVTVNDELAG